MLFVEGKTVFLQVVMKEIWLCQNEPTYCKVVGFEWDDQRWFPFNLK